MTFVGILYYVYAIVAVMVHSSNHICNNSSQCDFETIQCVDNEPCLIECSDDFACQYSTIICPKNDSCNVQCIGNSKRNQCAYINITATHSTMLILNVSSTSEVSPRTMRNSHIYCPNTQYNITKFPNCLIQCNGVDLMKKSVIYTRNGFEDIAIEASDLCYRIGEMYCDANYSTHCFMSNEAPFHCLGDLNGCETRMTDFPTINPTSNPILTPTLNPTVHIISTKSYSQTFISLHNNTFMTITVVLVLVIGIVVLVICIVCYKQCIQIKNEQNEIKEFPNYKEAEMKNEFNNFDEKVQLNLNENENGNINVLFEGDINVNRTQINEHVGEYSMVLNCD